MFEDAGAEGVGQAECALEGAREAGVSKQTSGSQTSSCIAVTQRHVCL